MRMKPMLVKGFCIGTLALLSLPSFAQTEKDKNDKDDKKETQQIIITRKNAGDEKTVIEIKGDKVTINGKDAAESKDVTVRTNKIRDMQNLSRLRTTNGQNWNFNFDDNFSLFSEDENRAMLGIATDVTEKGAEITSVNKESAAEKAGLKKGDIITKIGDRTIDDADDVTGAVRSHKPGDKVDLIITREGKEQKLTAELGKWKGVRMKEMRLPNPPVAPQTFRSYNGLAQQYNALAFGSTPKLGLSVQDTDDGKGVKVLEADEDGNAAKAGLKKDDIITNVNDKEITNTDEITKAIRDSRSKGSVKLQVLRGGKSQTIDVMMPRKLKKADL